MRRGRRIGVLHHRSAQDGVDVNGVVLVANELAVVVERAPRSRGTNYGDARSLLILTNRGARDDIGTASVGAEAWQRDNIASPAYGDSGHWRFPPGATAGAAGARIGGDSAARHRVRSAARAVFRGVGFRRARAFSG